MTPRKRLINLVRVLSSPETELIGSWWVGGQHIDSLELTPTGVRLNIWTDSTEFYLLDSEISDEAILDLVYELEQILLN
jgi:hypothetical protein